MAELRWREGRFLGDDPLGDGPAVAEAPAGSSPSSSSAAARVTPAVLFITVVLAVVLLASGLLHVLRRLFLKSHRANARAEAQPDIEEQKLEQQQDAASDDSASSVVLSVRLGRFKNTQRSDAAAAAGDDDAYASSTSSCIDARRCYSMGSYQYVLADDNLQISVHWRPGDGITGIGAAAAAGANVATARTADKQPAAGKKVFARGDSFSMSKIWQWRGGDRRLPVLHSDASPPANDGLPWATAATRTRQESDT
uniref:Uncharacterized protein n=1 Tax=Oryza brachyantha TaxID=4533 RepID=J3MX28_ORYBR